MESESSDKTIETGLERELGMGRGAIRMVAEAHYPSVTITSLRYGHEALEILEPEAARAGVILVPLAAMGGGTDLRAQREEWLPRHPR